MKYHCLATLVYKICMFILCLMVSVEIFSGKGFNCLFLGYLNLSLCLFIISIALISYMA
jgi:hypothetical protein